MKRILFAAVLVCLSTPALLAQENYTEGPVWRVSLIRVKPNHMDEYLTSLAKHAKIEDCRTSS